jgi:hypothetical protein
MILVFQPESSLRLTDVNSARVSDTHIAEGHYHGKLRVVNKDVNKKNSFDSCEKSLALRE